MFLDKNRREALYHSGFVFAVASDIIQGVKKTLSGSDHADKRLRSLLQEHGSFENIFKAYTKVTPEELTRRKTFEKAAKKIEQLPHFNTLTIHDEQFPSSLKNNLNAVPVLYTRGDLSLLESEKSIAVVGTRQLTDGVDREQGERVVQRLLNQQYVIVSGLAEGCDTLAHQYAVNHRGRTIAVLGTPLNQCFPMRNKTLQERIAREHLLISQYPIGLRVFPSYFAHRNKTTVNLSSGGVIVVRAGDRSGTQHAIKHCVEQGKDLYALANNFDRGYAWIETHRDKIKIPNPPSRE